MYLRSLLLHDFRNVARIEIFPDPGFNIIWGENAQGKTNILESIYLLGHLKSFRGSRNEDLIRIDHPFSRVSGDVIEGNTKHSISLTIQSQGKSARVDGKSVNRSSDFLGYFPSVLFSPEEVSLVRGYPAGRRALLDRAVFQTDHSFLDKSREYLRILKQRNLLLKQGCNREQLDPWTESLILCGSQIRKLRCRYLLRMVPFFKRAYQAITNGVEDADLIYPIADGPVEEMQYELRNELSKRFSQEARLGTTLAGPHRDDPFFIVNGRSLKIYGSQGQQRSFMLAFKTAQIMDLEKNSGLLPVLLLDDMTGELDKKRKEFFFQFLRNRRGQVFVTTTELQSIISEGFNDAASFRINKGSILENDC